MSTPESSPDIIDIDETRRVDDDFNAGMDATRSALSEAIERGDTYEVSKFPRSGLVVGEPDPRSTAVLRVMQRAVDMHGAAVAEKFKLNEDKLVISHNQLAAAIRGRYGNLEERKRLLSLSPAELQKLEDIEEPMPVIPTAGFGDTGNIESGDTGMSVGAFATDLQTAKENTFLSNQIDHSTYMIAARALAEMKTAANSDYDKELATDALEQLEKLPEVSEEVQAVIHPENLRRVRLASILGPKAGELVANAVVKHRLAA